MIGNNDIQDFTRTTEFPTDIDLEIPCDEDGPLDLVGLLSPALEKMSLKESIRDDSKTRIEGLKAEEETKSAYVPPLEDFFEDQPEYYFMPIKALN